jgi:transcriptional regulator with XRE-family HTH domain
MACQLDISQPAYYKLESGRTQISTRRLNQIARILNVNPAELYACPLVMIAEEIKPITSAEKELYEKLLAQVNAENLLLKGLLAKQMPKTNF